MTGKELLERFNLGEKLIAEFTNKIEEVNSQWEDGMRADIIDVYCENDTVCVHIDSSDYIEFNKEWQKPIWFNNKTMQYDATRDEFLENEDDTEIYDDILYIKPNDNLDIIEIR